jgi:hypothetical protein
METNAILSALNGKRKRAMTSIAADKTTIQIDSDTNLILTAHRNQYQVKTGKKLGKSAYLWILLKQFRDAQLALLRYSDVDPKVFDTGFVPALYEFKMICRRYMGKSIKTQSHAILAILMYSSTREYELANDMKVTNYLDDEYEDDMLEAKGYNIRPPPSPPAPVVRHMSPAELTELYEEN